MAGGGIGDNEPPPEPEILPEAEPRLEAPRAPVGWTVPGYTVGGLYYPPTRYPKLPNGKSWPIATPEAIKSILQHERGKLPEMVIFVPLDRVGPTLIGSDNVQEYRIPSGYSEVKLFGTPQVTRNNSGVETNHARNGILEALRLAETDEFKDIFFNRSFSVATRGVVKSVIRPDVTAIPRPSLNSQYSVHPYESLSPGQTKEEREEKMPNVPGIARLRAEHYKLLRLLMKYYLAHRIGHR